MGERWVRPAALIVAAELMFALVVTQSLGHRGAPPVMGYVFLFGQILAVTVLVILFWQIISLRGAPNPTRRLIATASANRDLLAPMLIGIGLAILQKAALTWVKPAVPLVAGFWADPLLADLDKALFTTDPWRLTQLIAGRENVAIDWIYGLWFPFVISALLLVLASRQEAKSRVIVAYFLTVAFAIGLQFALPSGGPIFFERNGFGDRFAEMISTLPYIAKTGASYLWLYHSSHHGGTAVGLSAMPSVHIALATWVVIAARELRRSLLPLALAWWALILFGSVYLGWHYVLDGVAATVIAAVAFRLSFAKLVPFPGVIGREREVSPS